MKVAKLSWIVAIVVAIFPQTSLAQQNVGGRGLFYVHSARAMGKGYLNTYFHSRFFGKLGGTGESICTYWDVQGSVTINVGLSDRVELSFFPIVYQDTQEKIGNIPDDLFIRFKLLSLGNPTSSFQYGIMFNSRFPTAKKHNIIYEPYSAGKLEVGFTILGTYLADPLYPDEAAKVHFNLGYVFHNDAGDRLTDAPDDSITNSSISSEMIYGFGLRYPFEKWDVTVELNGNMFIQKPAVTAYTRENCFYFTPGLSYKAARWMRVDFGVDFRLTPDKDETEYLFGINRLPHQLPSSYPDWRAHMGIKLAILPTSVYRSSERDLILRKAESRRQLFEQIIREKQETEKAEQELERIKQERIKAEKELQRLRKLLEGERKKKNQPQQQEPEQ